VSDTRDEIPMTPAEGPRSDLEAFEAPAATLVAETAVAETNGANGAYGRLLRNQKFRRLWYAQFVSGIGDWLVIGLLLPIVSALSGNSSTAVAGIYVAKIIPALVLSSFTGALVDRFDRRKVMITADLTRMVLALGLLFTNSLFVIYLIVLLMETASLFFYPARNSLIPYLVDEEDIVSANGLSYTTQQASMLVGLVASAGILAAFEFVVRGIMDSGVPLVANFVGLFSPALLGPRAGVVLDSVTFLFSALMISSIAVKASAAKHGAKGLDLSLLGKDAIESFKFLRDHLELRGFLVAISVAIIGGGTIITVGLTYIRASLTGGVPLLGVVPGLKALVGSKQTFVMVCLALGMVLGALVVPRVEHRFRLQLLFAGSVAGFGFAMLGFATVRTYWIACLFIVLAGGFIATVTVAGQSYVVRTTDDAIRGRVFTALESVVRVSLLLSMFVMAPLGDLFAKIVQDVVKRANLPYDQLYLTGPRITLWFSGLIVLAASVYAFRTLQWRKCEDPECDPPPVAARSATDG
jgi:dTMP kinase